MDINNPDGTGNLTITRMSIESDSVFFDFEGKVEGYGSVFCSHVMSSVDSDKTRGVMSGEARTFLDDGTFITSPHRGTFKRDKSSIINIGNNSLINGRLVTESKNSKIELGDNVFVGSNSSLIAPVKLEKNSIVGAGSVISKNVKKNSLGITRPFQVEVKNYKKKKKK